MSLFKRRPHRLYVSTGRKWFTRRRSTERVRSTTPFFKGTLRPYFTWFFKNGVILILGGGLFLAFAFFLFFSSYLSIHTIEVSRENFSVDSAAVDEILSPYKGRNLLVFNRQLAEDALFKAFPEFSEIRIKKVFPHTLKVELITFPVVANLRAYYTLPKPAPEPSTAPAVAAIEGSNAFDLTPESNEKEEEQKPIEQKCLLNRMGQAIFDKEENLELITVTLRGLSQPIQNREQVLDPAHMEGLLESLAYFENIFQKKIVGVDYFNAAREIHLKTEDRVSLWITFERDPKEQLDKLKSVYEPAELDKQELSYVDLRIQNKVIYCLRRTACDKPL